MIPLFPAFLIQHILVIVVCTPPHDNLLQIIQILRKSIVIFVQNEIVNRTAESRQIKTIIGINTRFFIVIIRLEIILCRCIAAIGETVAAKQFSAELVDGAAKIDDLV